MSEAPTRHARRDFYATAGEFTPPPTEPHRVPAPNETTASRTRGTTTSGDILSALQRVSAQVQANCQHLRAIERQQRTRNMERVTEAEQQVRVARDIQNDRKELDTEDLGIEVSLKTTVTRPWKKRGGSARGRGGKKGGASGNYRGNQNKQRGCGASGSTNKEQ